MVTHGQDKAAAQQPAGESYTPQQKMRGHGLRKARERSRGQGQLPGTWTARRSKQQDRIISVQGEKTQRTRKPCTPASGKWLVLQRRCRGLCQGEMPTTASPCSAAPACTEASGRLPGAGVGPAGSSWPPGHSPGGTPAPAGTAHLPLLTRCGSVRSTPGSQPSQILS